MTRNRPSRQAPRLGIEVFEARCLLSLAGAELPAEDLVPLTARSAAAVAPASAATTRHDADIGASVARERYGLSGSGLTAAVIDTGIDPGHPAFGGGFGPGSVVVGGHDFGDGDADPTSHRASHGTAVAGIIASRAPNAPGVAPAANIVALRVFDDTGKGSFDGIANSLQWVIDHHKRHNISVVNLSISDGNNYLTAPTLFASPVIRRITGLIDQLEALNIPVVTAAGNSFKGQQGMGFTAIVDNTISVTGSDGDRLAADAQRLGKASGGKSATDLAAPGVDVLGPWEGASFAPLDGTSFAAPLVTGSVLLLQELYLKRFGALPSVSQVEGWLRDSASPLRDPVTGIVIGRLDVPAAAARVPTPQVATPGNGGGGGSKPSNPAQKPTQGGTPKGPSSPAAEPPASSGGSGGKGTNGKGTGGKGTGGTGSGSTGGSKPATPPPMSSPTTPPGRSGGGGGGGSGPGSAPGSGSTSKPTTPPSQAEPPAASRGAGPVVEPPPASGPVEPDPPSSSPAPDAAPPSGSEAPPASPTPPEAAAPVEAPAADPIPIDDAAPPPATGPIDPGSGVGVIDAAIEGLGSVEDDEPAGPSEPVVDPAVPPVLGEVPAGQDPVVAIPINDTTDRLAALFRPAGPALGVRAWNVSRPGVAAAVSRAQILRASRASAVSQPRAVRADAPRPIPAASLRPALIRRPSL